VENRKWLSFLSLTLAGISLGWLIGLSVSEVLHIFLGGLFALASGVVSVLAGIKKSPSGEESDTGEKDKLAGKLQPVSPLPLTALLLGIAIGAPMGTYVRTNDLLGVRAERFVSRWEKTNLPEQDLYLRLFDTLYSGTETQRSSVQKQSLGALYASYLSADTCAPIILESGASLKAELELLADETILKALEKCDSDSCLEAIKVMLCTQ